MLMSYLGIQLFKASIIFSFFLCVVQEALKTVPPLNIVHKRTIFGIRALERCLGALDVLHHVVAGSLVRLVVSLQLLRVDGHVPPVDHHHRLRLLRASVPVGGGVRRARNPA